MGRRAERRRYRDARAAEWRRRASREKWSEVQKPMSEMKRESQSPKATMKVEQNQTEDEKTWCQRQRQRALEAMRPPQAQQA